VEYSRTFWTELNFISGRIHLEPTRTGIIIMLVVSNLTDFVMRFVAIMNHFSILSFIRYDRHLNSLVLWHWLVTD
jgi:hypothetical protein